MQQAERRASEDASFRAAFNDASAAGTRWAGHSDLGVGSNRERGECLRRALDGSPGKVVDGRGRGVGPFAFNRESGFDSRAPEGRPHAPLGGSVSTLTVSNLCVEEFDEFAALLFIGAPCRNNLSGTHAVTAFGEVRCIPSDLSHERLSRIQ